MRMSSRSSSPRWKVSRRGGPTGAPARWRSALASAPPPWAASGAPSGLQPHVVESFKISDDPLFIEKVRDIVGLYLNPPDHAVVLSFDEKPQIQALERAQPILPMDMGRPERQTHNYIRHGTVDLFAALNVATGQVVAQTKKQHRSRDFVSFLREIDERVDPTLTVHVIPRQSLGA